MFEEQIQKDDEKVQETQRPPAALASSSPEIKAVQEEIQLVSEKITAVEEEIRLAKASNDKEEVRDLRKEKEQLRKEKEQLRKKEEQILEMEILIAPHCPPNSTYSTPGLCFAAAPSAPELPGTIRFLTVAS